MKKPIYDTQHPVALAVEPLRAEALKRAEQEARKTVENVKTRLKSHNMDRQAYAPYPDGKIPAIEFMVYLRRYNLVRTLTKALKSCGFMNAPEPCEMNSNGIAKFVKQAIENADFEYTGFICKMVGKIGACENATLTGSHVWGFSILAVTKGDVVEHWKTQQIVNVSKLGTMFNQWPSRKVKGV